MSKQLSPLPYRFSNMLHRLGVQHISEQRNNGTWIIRWSAPPTWAEVRRRSHSLRKGKGWKYIGVKGGGLLPITVVFGHIPRDLGTVDLPVTEDADG